MKSKAPHTPALTRTFDALARCETHLGDLLTSDGECPRCEREAHQARMADSENAREAARLQAMTSVHAGKRRSAA